MSIRLRVAAVFLAAILPTLAPAATPFYEGAFTHPTIPDPVITEPEAPEMAQSSRSGPARDIYVSPPFKLIFGTGASTDPYLQGAANGVLNLCTGVSCSSVGPGLPTSTVANLPAAAANTNKTYLVTDGTSSTDCTTGGASTRAICASNGAAWVSVGGSGSGLPTLPTSPNSVPESLTSTPSGGVGGAAAWSLPGVVGRAVTGTTSTDTIGAADCIPQRVAYQGSVSVGVTLPTATTLGVANCVLLLVNNTTGSSTTVTITPTVWQINGASPFVLQQGQQVRLTVDAAGSAWDADPVEAVMLAGANITLTRSATGGITVAATTPSGFLVQAPANTAANTIAPTANSTVSLTVLGTTGTGTPHLFDVCTNSAGACGSNYLNVASGGVTTIASLATGGATSTGNYSSSNGTAFFYQSTQTNNASYGMGNQSSGNITGLQTFGIGDNSSTGGNSAASTVTRGGDETGATGNNTAGNWTARGGNVSTTATGTPGAASVTGGSQLGAATNAAGATVTIAGGLGTGNATCAPVKIQTPNFSTTSGTTAQVEVTRMTFNCKAGSLTSGTATNMFNIAVAANQTAGASVLVHVETTQATPHNCSTFQGYTLVAQNTSSTITTNVQTIGSPATICDTGTLTLTVAASGANPTVFSVTPAWTTIVPTGVIITVEIHNLSQQDVTLL